MIFYREVENENYNKYKIIWWSNVGLTDRDRINFPAKCLNNP